jgi:hypothetical protein
MTYLWQNPEINTRRLGRLVRRAYRVGKATGYEAALYAEWDGFDPSSLEQSAYEAEEHARQYSPFEHFAAELNSAGEYSDDLWDAYERGVAAGIDEGMKERLKE